MKILNYLPDEMVSIYAKSQWMGLCRAESELDLEWEHAYLVKRLIDDTKAAVIDTFGEKVFDAEISEMAIHQRRVEKYTTWIEVLRLAKYHYGRFSNFKKTMSEGLYSTLAALGASYGNSCKPKRIAVLGCGPGRSVADFAKMFPNSQIIGLDYSIMSLVVANHVLNMQDGIFSMPIRNMIGTCVSSVFEVKSLGLENVQLGVCDLMQPHQEKYDMIICSNTINLLPDHQKAVNNVVSMLDKNGILIFADLIGWRLDRKKEQKVLCSKESIISVFESLGVQILEYFSGGPYVEEETPENSTCYMEHFVVGKKI